MELIGSGGERGVAMRPRGLRGSIKERGQV